MALEEVVGGKGGCRAGDNEVPGEADAAGSAVGRELAVIEGMLGELPRPPEHEVGGSGGGNGLGDGIDEHGTKVVCKSDAGGCSHDGGASGGSIVAIEEVQG